MAEASTGRTGRRPDVRFHSREAPAVTDAQRRRADDAYEHQAADTLRFDAAAPTLLGRLAPPPEPVIAITCDHRFVELFENWAASCDHHGIDVRSSTIAFPTDADAHERVEALGFVSWFDPDSQALAALTDSGGYGDLAWTGYMFHQNWVIDRLLAHGRDVLFQDADLVWRTDPRPQLTARARAGVDVQAMYDGPAPRFQPLYANTGFMYLHNSAATREFWEAVYARHDMVAYYRSQQEPLNVILAVHAHRSLTVEILDDDRFANGHRFSGARARPPDPWVVHHSWTRDLTEKLDRYRINGHWYLGASLGEGQPATTDTAGRRDAPMTTARLRDELAERCDDVGYPPLHGRYVSMVGRNGLGHRLLRNARIFHAARSAGYAVHADWFPWAHLFDDSEELFGFARDDAPPSWTFQNEPWQMRRTDPSDDAPEITVFDDLDITHGPDLSIPRGVGGDAQRWNREVFGPASADHLADFHLRLLRQLRTAWNERIDSFLTDTIRDRRMIALHLRTGNGETGDFVEKERGVPTESIVASFARHVRDRSPRDTVLVVASDSAATAELLRAHTDLDVVTFARSLPAAGHAIGTWVAPTERSQEPEPTEAERLEATFEAYADLVVLGAADHLVLGAWSSFLAGPVAMNRRRADLGTCLTMFDATTQRWLER